MMALPLLLLLLAQCAAVATTGDVSSSNYRQRKWQLPSKEAAAAVAGPAAGACPCGEPHLCQPLARRKAAKAHREVLGLCHWCSEVQLDWDALTILTSGGVDAMYWPSDSMLCAAHANGVPFLINHAMLSESAPTAIWNALSPNETARKTWVDQAVRMLTHYSNGTARRVAADGISFDWEDYTAGGVDANGTFGGDAAGWYVPLMAETKRAMRRSMPMPMINWDVSTKASIYHGWNMSATDLAEIDTFFIMSIDGSDGFEALHSPWEIPHHKPGFAHGLAPPQGLEWMINSEDGIGSILPTEKLVLGIAWYQVRWACSGHRPYPGPCPLATFYNGHPVKLNHSNDHVTSYSQVAQSLFGNTSFRARYENATATHFFDLTCPQDGPSACPSSLCVCSGWEGPSGPAQIFFDNPQTLRAKYELAVSLGVAGVGPYALNELARPRELDNVSWAIDMWAVLREFADPSGVDPHLSINDAGTPRRVEIKTDDDLATKPPCCAGMGRAWPCCANHCNRSSCPPSAKCCGGVLPPCDKGLIQKNGSYGQGNRSAVCPSELPFCADYMVNKHWGSCKLEAPPPPPPPPPQDPSAGLQTIGIYDMDGGETTPFPWHGRLMLVESVGFADAIPLTPPVYSNCSGGSMPWNDTRCPYFRIRTQEWDEGYTKVAESVVTAVVPGSAAMSFCNAILRNDSTGGASNATLWVYGTNNDNRWGGAPRSQVHVFWTHDLVSWRHAIALNITAQASNGMTGAYNVDVTSRPDGTSVMALEPAGACEGKGCQAMSYFAECPSCGVDLSGGWRLLDGAKFTAAALGEVDNPTIRYLHEDGYYYLVTARAHPVPALPPLATTRWTTMIARSRDLVCRRPPMHPVPTTLSRAHQLSPTINSHCSYGGVRQVHWEESPHLWGFASDPHDLNIIPGSALDQLGNNPDCMPYCNKSFVTAKNPGYDINRSDMDFWELGGPEGDGSVHVFVVWNAGNQGQGPGTHNHWCPHSCGASAAGVVKSSLAAWLQSYF